MATTYTPNYNLAQPEVGGEPDTWGGLLNVDLGILDTALKAVSNVANAALPLAGGTMTGNLGITRASGSASLTLSAVAGQTRSFVSYSAGSPRWEVVIASGEAEGGGNAGANFSVNRYSDAGAYLGTALAISRATGFVTLANRPSWGGGLTPWDSANFNPANYAALAGAAFFGAVTGTSLTLSGNVAAASVNANVGATPGLNVRDRTQGIDWSVYATGNAWRVYHPVNGDRMVVNSAGLVTAADFQSTSDARLKEDVSELRNGVSRLKGLRPRVYRKQGVAEAGFIAQEAQTELPTAVSVGADGYLTLSYGQVVALVAAAVLEVEERLAAVEALI